MCIGSYFEKTDKFGVVSVFIKKQSWNNPKNQI